MKYLLLCALVLCGCQNYLLTAIQFENPLPEDTDTIAGATEWVHYNITYVPSGDWKSPAHTMASGEGDCEDLAILLMWIVRDRWGIEGNLIVRELHAGGLHATAQFGDAHYDPTIGYLCWPPEDMVIMRLGYQETMNAVVWY